MSDDETLTLRPSLIGGERCQDDYEVVWRGMSIGRIRRAEASSHAELWAWNCWPGGRPCKADEAGGGTSLDDAKAQFREAWQRIRAEINEADIARARGAASSRAGLGFDRNLNLRS
ncbi:hypothetical protein IVB08_16820 [Bradyrhizobium sp. 173]|uniref:hypothetical protein n=1 Tax=Bradyrhizobium sp. 173 TaxID=2782644 RepID=UPI001FF7F68C|nr:hypothetical protein [Bradyrhizobium sp. 173]MCK1565606.1 hypothetical protein [Bradyrhizobium sp. 173]